MASVVDGTGDAANDQHDASLDGADPCYARGGFREDGAGFIVRLEDTEGIHETPSVEEQHEGADNVQPCCQSAVRNWARVGEGLLRWFKFEGTLVDVAGIANRHVFLRVLCVCEFCGMERKVMDGWMMEG